MMVRGTLWQCRQRRRLLPSGRCRMMMMIWRSGARVVKKFGRRASGWRWCRSVIDLLDKSPQQHACARSSSVNKKLSGSSPAPPPAKIRSRRVNLAAGTGRRRRRQYLPAEKDGPPVDDDAGHVGTSGRLSTLTAILPIMPPPDVVAHRPSSPPRRGIAALPAGMGLGRAAKAGSLVASAGYRGCQSAADLGMRYPVAHQEEVPLWHHQSSRVVVEDEGQGRRARPDEESLLDRR